jgi:hypothetical protein
MPSQLFRDFQCDSRAGTHYRLYARSEIKATSAPTVNNPPRNTRA